LVTEDLFLEDGGGGLFLAETFFGGGTLDFFNCCLLFQRDSKAADPLEVEGCFVSLVVAGGFRSSSSLVDDTLLVLLVIADPSIATTIGSPFLYRQTFSTKSDSSWLPSPSN
jgi:hypothetical protein